MFKVDQAVLFTFHCERPPERLHACAHVAREAAARHANSVLQVVELMHCPTNTEPGRLARFVLEANP